MVKLYTSHSDYSALSILITSFAVGIPNLECFITNTLPKKIVNESFEAFHWTLPLLNIDKRNNVSSTNAILLYLSSLQEKLNLVTGVETMEYLDIVQHTDDHTFLDIMKSRIEGASYLQKRDTCTLADIAVYPRLKALLRSKCAKASQCPSECSKACPKANECSKACESECAKSCHSEELAKVCPTGAKFMAYLEFVAKDKFFQEGEARFNKLLDEAVTQTVSLLNSGKLWELTKEEQASSLHILVSHYKSILPEIEKKDEERKAKLSEEQKEIVESKESGELAIKGIASDLEAYKKVIAMYEQSLKALSNE